MAPSRHDCKVVDWDVKPQPKQTNKKKLCCSSPKIKKTKRPNLKVFCQKHANGIANSEDPDQTAPLRAV